MAIKLRNETVAVIGLGAIGLPLALNLAKKGRTVQVWNRSDAAAETAVAAGATRVQTLSEIDAGIVLTALPDLPQVDSVLENGLEAALNAGDVLVVMGTVSPGAVRKLGQRLSAHSIHLLDAPVSGGDVGAQQGTLSIMVGGEADVFEAVKPTFELIGQTIKHLGALGAGEMAKACNQIVVAVTLSALAEALTLGEKAGLDRSALIDILEGGFANSQVLNVKRERFETNNYHRGGSATFQLKDLRFALEAGEDSGTALPVTTTVKELFEAVVAAGDGEEDHSVVIREIERRSN